MYPEEMVRPMRNELAEVGFQELYSAEAVENALKSEGTTLVVVNSVCGCAARNARPGAKMSLTGDKKSELYFRFFYAEQSDRLTRVTRPLATKETTGSSPSEKCFLWKHFLLTL